jgi:hypothetical protein
MGTLFLTSSMLVSGILSLSKPGFERNCPGPLRRKYDVVVRR